MELIKEKKEELLAAVKDYLCKKNQTDIDITLVEKKTTEIYRMSFELEMNNICISNKNEVHATERCFYQLIKDKSIDEIEFRFPKGEYFWITTKGINLNWFCLLLKDRFLILC